MTDTVLLVDDDEEMVDTIPGLLQKAGYKVEVYRHSLDTLLVFFTTPSRFDLVIVDEDMKDLSGSALARKLLHLRPNLPVILLFGSCGNGAGPKTETIGISRSLSKRAADTLLLEAVRDALQRTWLYRPSR
jgi:FixJ family two-component response regulator